MPHAMYFTGDPDTVTKINQVLYQTIEYNDNGMFTAKLMNDTPIEIFIDNGTTPSILPLRTYVRRNLAVHRSVTPFVIRQPIQRPRLLERVYKPMHTLH